MKKAVEKFAILAIHVFCIIAVIELGVNYSAFHFLFPIKNSNSFGYVTKKGAKTIVPLNKYSSRLKAQFALPYELAKSTLTNEKELIKSYDKLTKKYGFIDENFKTKIDYKFDLAEDFKNDYAVVAIKVDNTLKYGTINKNGDWLVEPKYEHLCPFMRYYTKACLDKNHCGVIDKYGNEITLLSYQTDKIDKAGSNYGKKLCTIGEKNEIHCNYFLW